MTDLRRAREARGMSLEEAARRTRIPQKWLDALERGDTAAFPQGPFLSGYTRQYRSFLDLPEKPVELAPEPAPRMEPPRPEARAPRAEPMPRAFAPEVEPRRASIETPELPEAVRRTPEDVTETTAAFRRNTPRLLLVGGLAVVMVLFVAQRIATAFPEAASGLGVAPDQVVTIATDDELRIKVVADGRVVQDGVVGVTTTDPHVYRAHDRLELSVPTLEGVRIRYNGEPLSPLGALSRPRRLVFSDVAE